MADKSVNPFAALEGDWKFDYGEKPVKRPRGMKMSSMTLEERKAYFAEAARRSMAKKREMGLCKCGRRPPERPDGKGACAECKARARSYYKPTRGRRGPYKVKDATMRAA